MSAHFHEFRLPLRRGTRAHQEIGGIHSGGVHLSRLLLMLLLQVEIGVGNVQLVGRLRQSAEVPAPAVTQTPYARDEAYEVFSRRLRWLLDGQQG